MNTKAVRVDLPFALVLPDVPSAIQPNRAGGYDITVQVICLDQPGKSTYPAAPFVDGVQRAGVALLSADELYTFTSVVPQAGKETVLSFKSLTDLAQDGIKLIIADLTSLLPTVIEVSEKKPSILISASYPGPDKYSSVRIRLIDGTGKPRSGQIDINASQKFYVGNSLKMGYCLADVKDGPQGSLFKIKPVSYGEGFQFTDLETQQTVTQIITKR